MSFKSITRNDSHFLHTFDTVASAFVDVQRAISAKFREKRATLRVIETFKTDSKDSEHWYLRCLEHIFLNLVVPTFLV